VRIRFENIRYINNIVYIVSAATCFNASASPSERLNLVLATVTKLLKLQLSKNNKLKYSRDRCCVINVQTVNKTWKLSFGGCIYSLESPMLVFLVCRLVVMQMH